MRAVSFSATPSFLLSARCCRFAGKAAELDLFYHDKQNGLASESVLFIELQTKIANCIGTKINKNVLYHFEIYDTIIETIWTYKHCFIFFILYGLYYLHNNTRPCCAFEKENYYAKYLFCKL